MDNVKRDYRLRLSLLEKNYRQVCKEMDIFINLSKEKLESSTEGLVFLDEKAKEWTGRSLFSESMEKEIGENVDKKMLIVDVSTRSSVRT